MRSAFGYVVGVAGTTGAWHAVVSAILMIGAALPVPAETLRCAELSVLGRQTADRGEAQSVPGTCRGKGR
jgi:hypothetical protein